MNKSDYSSADLLEWIFAHCTVIHKETAISTEADAATAMAKDSIERNDEQRAAFHSYCNRR